jgi:ATP phosphoribosyltransferase
VPSLVDAIVEGTETGATLRAHGLEIIDELLASTTRFIANTILGTTSGSARNCRTWRRCCKARCRPKAKWAEDERAALQSGNYSKMLPAMNTPTISPLSDESWVALEIIADESKSAI